MHARRAAEEAPSVEGAPAEGERSLERLLDRVEEPRPAIAPNTGLRAARVLSVGNGAATIAWRGSGEAVAAYIAPGVETALLEDVAKQQGAVLVEPGPPPIIVGVLQTGVPRELKLRAGRVEIEGETEVVVRSGRSALRLRADGDIEIVGSRIHAASRGLFRLVGRILRLN